MAFSTRTNWKAVLACISVVTLTGAGVAGYTVVKEDITENRTKIVQNEKQNNERYKTITNQLDTIITHLLKQTATE